MVTRRCWDLIDKVKAMDEIGLAFDTFTHSFD